MPLNLNNGDFTPHIRYMASTSSWTLSTDDGQQPFTFTKAIVNLATIETGWGYFSEGVAPEWVMDPSLETKAPRPDGQDWKRGFRVNVYSEQMFGDEPNREFATTATGAVKGIEESGSDSTMTPDAIGARRSDWTIHIGLVVRAVSDLMGLIPRFESGNRKDAVLRSGEGDEIAVEWEWNGVWECPERRRPCGPTVGAEDLVD